VFQPKHGRFLLKSLSKTAHFGAAWRCSVVWTTDSDGVGVQLIISCLEERAMFDSNDHKRDLECLRLASDLMQVASDTLNPHLKAHCLRMAKVWSAEAEKPPVDSAAQLTGLQSASLY
jgi:hypothetical protein